jgi:hypothetical protein
MNAASNQNVLKSISCNIIGHNSKFHVSFQRSSVPIKSFLDYTILRVALKNLLHIGILFRIQPISSHLLKARIGPAF